MFRRLVLFAAVTLVIAVTASAAPIKLPRHPDYHAGTVAFSYLGDIWLASEDGSNVRRLTDNRAREVYPRFSPDGRWIAFSSNRYGNYDVFVIPAAGGAARRLTFHSGNDEMVGWTRDSQKVIFRDARGNGAFPSVATLYAVATSPRKKGRGRSRSRRPRRRRGATCNMRGGSTNGATWSRN